MELSTTTIFLINAIVGLIMFIAGRETMARRMSKEFVSCKDCEAKHKQEATANAEIAKTLSEIKDAMKEAVASIKASEDRQWEALRIIAVNLPVPNEIKEKILNVKGSKG